MDVTSNPVAPTPDDVRREFRAWLGEHWDPEFSLVEWRTRLLGSGWSVPMWSTRWHGRGLPAWSEQIVHDELTRAGAVGLRLGGGTHLAAPTIMEHGPDLVRERFLPPILTGTETWCQLFSEPGAGSDLAGLSTTAVLDGDSWIVNGQKVWNTSAHHADFGMLVARTNWDVPKHRGLTYFALPMLQPSVEVRPLKQMNFHSSFNEVFLTDAVIPKEFVIGHVGEGWSAARTTLAYERRYGSMSRQRLTSTGRAIDEARAEADDHFMTYKWYPQRAGRPDLAESHARSAGVSSNPIVRQELAKLICLQRASRWTAERAAASRALGRKPGPEGSLGKLATSHVARQASKVHSLIGGAHGMLSGPSAPLDGMLAEILISVPAQSIAGGTDEIQRNILGESALGLPREPASDTDLPFSDVRRST